MFDIFIHCAFVGAIKVLSCCALVLCRVFFLKRPVDVQRLFVTGNNIKAEE